MISAIIQARLEASRLPGKTLMPICGRPMLYHILERVKSCTNIDKIVVATTNTQIDRRIIEFSEKCGVLTYAGDSDDVLDRYYQAAKSISADIIVRITADDPFKDPKIIEQAVNYFCSGDAFDYVSNTIEPTYPEGLDVEVFSFKALKKAWQEANTLAEREHVTPYIWKNPHIFKIFNFKSDRDLSDIRLTVDYPQDLILAKQIYNRLYRGQVFFLDEIITLLINEPELVRINDGIARNEGYLKSLQQQEHTHNCLPLKRK